MDLRNICRAKCTLCKYLKDEKICTYEGECLFKPLMETPNKSISMENKPKSKLSKQVKYGRFLLETISTMETVAVNDDNCDKAEELQKNALIKLEYLLKIIGHENKN